MPVTCRAFPPAALAIAQSVALPRRAHLDLARREQAARRECDARSGGVRADDGELLLRELVDGGSERRFHRGGVIRLAGGLRLLLFHLLVELVTLAGRALQVRLRLRELLLSRVELAAEARVVVDQGVMGSVKWQVIGEPERPAADHHHAEQDPSPGGRPPTRAHRSDVGVVLPVGHQWVPDSGARCPEFTTLTRATIER